MTRVRCVQANVAFGDPTANTAAALEQIALAQADRVEVLVFPECFLTGYVVGSQDEAEALALPAVRAGTLLSEPGPCLGAIERAAAEADLAVVVGFAGKDDEGLYNGAAVMGAGMPASVYSKAHLPLLGFDRFAAPGRSLPVFDTPFGKLGVLVCFDLRIPEAARTLALRGAELVVLPTNWPEGAEATPTHYAPTRASENRVFLATCNRVGEERGVRFIGESAVHGVDGARLAYAGREEGTITVDVDLALARDKRRVVVPGVYETDTFATRQPAIYER